MKNTLLEILKIYLKIFPEEVGRQTKLIEYINSQDDDSVTDWNNFDGHIVASGFVYAKEEQKFLVLYHKDLKTYLYPGGHITVKDSNPLEAAKREVSEETGLTNFKQLTLIDENLVPLDIDAHLIAYNERLDLPEHYHFDFRYIFTIDKISDIEIDTDELASYRWIDMDELVTDYNYGKVISKIKELLSKVKIN